MRALPERYYGMLNSLSELLTVFRGVAGADAKKCEFYKQFIIKQLCVIWGVEISSISGLAQGLRMGGRTKF